VLPGVEHRFGNGVAVQSPAGRAFEAQILRALGIRAPPIPTLEERGPAAKG
jgi:hypothetical protein